MKEEYSEGRKINIGVGVKVKDRVNLLLSLPESTEKRLSPSSPNRTSDVFIYEMLIKMWERHAT